MELTNWIPTYSTVCMLHTRRLIKRYHSVREAVRRSPSHTKTAPIVALAPIDVPSDVLTVLGRRHRVIRGLWCCSEDDVMRVAAYLFLHGIRYTVSGRCFDLRLTGEYYLVR